MASPRPKSVKARRRMATNARPARIINHLLHAMSQYELIEKARRKAGQTGELPYCGKNTRSTSGWWDAAVLGKRALHKKSKYGQIPLLVRRGMYPSESPDSQSGSHALPVL